MTTNWYSMVCAAQQQTACAVLGPELMWSGPELLRRGSGAADWMDRLQIPVGSPVPALLQSNGDALALLLAGSATGRPLAPLGPRLTQRELVECVGRLHSRVLVTQPRFEVLARSVASAAGCRVEIVPPLPAVTDLLPPPEPTDPALVLHTSGTTGLPKTVCYRHEQLVSRTRINAGLIGIGPGTTFATAAPFHHIAGVGNLLVAMASGATLALLPEFTVGAWQELAGFGVTHALAVPTMIELLLRQDALALPALTTLAYGGSPIHPHTLSQAMRALPETRFLNLFGQTEGSPLTYLSPDDHRRAAAGRGDLLRSVGRAVPGVELKILPGSDGDVGEVLARGDHLAGGDPWLHTGDIGRFDHEGYLFLVARQGERIIRGGENVYPLEVETVLAMHPEVREVAVAGIPDQVYGEAVKAFIVAAHGDTPPEPEALRRHARASLAGFKVPSEWSFVESLPRNASGKLLRRRLPG
jgi:acyl-CoA synthetase (AMP-forming)/AMP-acid ligase II